MPLARTMIFCKIAYSENSVEIVYFGLLPYFVGRGWGRWALEQAIAKAWDMPADRLWVHTCDLDHPRALGNYQARGFQIYKVETVIQEIPPQPPGPWQGA